MEGVTGVIRTHDQVMNVHSGNQLRLSIDLSGQQAKEAMAKEIEFNVDPNLAHAEETDPFLATDAGQSKHPWTKTPGAPGQRSQPHAVADPSSGDIPKQQVAPVVGGPPVG